eukprot:6660264-Prymnesium_polylepis.1
MKAMPNAATSSKCSPSDTVTAPSVCGAAGGGARSRRSFASELVGSTRTGGCRGGLAGGLGT